MPSRIIREGIITSIQVNSLSWAAEIFYRRLMSIADDFGRYYAHPTLLKAALYPLQLEKVSDSDVGKWILETEEAGLIRVYSVQGPQYLEICKFKQHIRAKCSKFPGITDATHDAIQMRADCALDAKQMRPNANANAHAETNAHAEAQGRAGVPLPKNGKSHAPQPPSEEDPEDGDSDPSRDGDGDDDGYGAMSPDLLRIVRDAGAEFNFSPAKIPGLNQWIRLVGYELAKQCLDEAMAKKGLSGFRALAYIQTVSISRRAEQDIRARRPAHQQSGRFVRQDR